MDNIKRKTVYYRSIINTYKHSQNSDYISQLVKAAQDRMDKQEKATYQVVSHFKEDSKDIAAKKIERLIDRDLKSA